MKRTSSCFGRMWNLAHVLLRSAKRSQETTVFNTPSSLSNTVCLINDGESSPLGRDLLLRKLEGQLERNAQLAFALPCAPILASRAPVEKPENQNPTYSERAVCVALALPDASTSRIDDSLPFLSPSGSLSFSLSETIFALGNDDFVEETAMPLADITRSTRARENRMALGVVAGR